MYCVKCGVELADSQRKCPLCSTPVYFPGLVDDPETPYPPFDVKTERVKPRGVYFIISFGFLIAAAISVFCDVSINGSLGWSGYVIGGLLLAYISLILPGWFARYYPAVFTPVSFAVLAAYLAYINYAAHGDWFLTLALPLCGVVALITCSVVILSYYLRRGYLYIWGGAIIATGGFSVLIEWLTHVTFNIDGGFIWSFYPAISLGLIGLMLIIIAIVRPFRESLRRIFSL